ncbi:MAG: hypothetical protein IJI65_09295 [Lachnospiraceae bacterium]|nr:hypothetical protein [Lachnospiraceae bacterium]
MPGWLQGFFSTGQLFTGPSAIWNACMLITEGLMGMGPDTYAPEAWAYVRDTLYPWFLAVGSILLTLFCLIGFVRQASNLKDNITIEMWIELFIKLIIGHFLMNNGITIMQSFFGIASGTTLMINDNTIPTIWTSDIDAGAVMMYILVGIIYVIASVICGITIVIEVLSRYLNLYILVATAPIALSTLAGGRGIEDTAYAWIKSFLTNVFQIVAIALILRIGGMMCQSTVFSMTGADGFAGFFSGAPNVLVSMLTMFFMTSAVKGADGLIKRAFNLR